MNIIKLTVKYIVLLWAMYFGLCFILMGGDAGDTALMGIGALVLSGSIVIMGKKGFKDILGVCLCIICLPITLPLSIYAAHKEMKRRKEMKKFIADMERMRAFHKMMKEADEGFKKFKGDNHES